MKGRSRSADIHKVICGIVDSLLRLSVAPFFLWVPSRFNLADAPSRGLVVQDFCDVDAKKGIAAAMTDMRAKL